MLKQISIFVENKPGRLSSVTKILSENKIDIKALSIADTKDFGILRLIVDNTDKAVDVLKKAGCTVTQTSVIGMSVEDRPGGLADIMSILYENGIGVEYMYAFVSKPDENTAFVILRVENNDKTTSVLEKNNIRLLSSIDVKNM
ncbi:MAG: ACT domain-containing protein [Oscillospiraceae bacterium]|nr:ACT domain-containing protein [Oscillospiraceae bacterium]